MCARRSGECRSSRGVKAEEEERRDGREKEQRREVEVMKERSARRKGVGLGAAERLPGDGGKGG